MTADPPLAPEPEHELKSTNPSWRGLHIPWRKDIENEGYSETPMREGEHLKRRGGYMDLVSNVWHWHAVEWGGKCKLSFDFARTATYVTLGLAPLFLH